MCSPARKGIGWFVAGAASLLCSVSLLGVAQVRSQQVPSTITSTSTSKATGAPVSTPPGQPSKPPPLELDEDGPLHLDAPAPTRPVPPGSAQKLADNTACLVCHANFRKENLAATHASHAVSCTSCHGPSIAHRNDEANVIPPDRMFAAGSIDGSCARCHDGHDVEPRAVVQRFLEKSSKSTDMKSIECTSCHGEHHLAVRTVRWDRKTGKLLAGGKK